ncbi:hypothetical protein PSTG_03645 [Puccinia striiformis f. sp. tritici PST-78]|uniref:Uncharacterized protein n=1 Tax=Puccinia striiformis f. sp. tritici PST-78 TaxID=1165861 RepID=A0A0L0VVN9_9BASI|nr:hypothetical protein PSTG_03645 [Puccinia striiformis f. sp. tritici PST-78]
MSLDYISLVPPCIQSHTSPSPRQQRSFSPVKELLSSFASASLMDSEGSNSILTLAGFKIDPARLASTFASQSSRLFLNTDLQNVHASCYVTIVDQSQKRKITGCSSIEAPDNKRVACDKGNDVDDVNAVINDDQRLSISNLNTTVDDNHY